MLPLSANCQAYIRNELYRRIGLTEAEKKAANTLVRYGDPASFPPNSLGVARCADDAAQQLLNLPQEHLRWVAERSALPERSRVELNGPLPVLLWGKGCNREKTPFAERRRDGTVIIYADIFAASLFMLSRWEEQVSTAHDEHGRFPAAMSVASKQGFLQRPIVDEYALVLGAWLRTLIPGFGEAPLEPTIRLSHDIDSLIQSPSLKDALRKSYDLTMNERRPAAGVLALAAYAKVAPDPYTRGISKLAELSGRHGLASVFNWMAARPGPYDPGYRLDEPATVLMLRSLAEQGMELGFHPSYRSADDSLLFSTEKEALERAAGGNVRGGRQHYLRFRVPDTWRVWEQHGFEYDSTLGYAASEGFRAGTCWRFRPFDLIADREMRLWEEPLLVMDTTLRFYQALTPLQGRESILRLAECVKRVGGTFTLLWHNSSFTNSWKPWGRMYSGILEELRQMMRWS